MLGEGCSRRKPIETHMELTTNSTDMAMRSPVQGQYQLIYGIPAQIYAQLDSWGALPQWSKSKLAEKTLQYWLSDIKARIIDKNKWPKEIGKFELKIVEGNLRQGDSDSPCGPNPTIAVSSSLPVQLEALLNIMNYPILNLQPMGSDTKQRYIDPAKLDKAASKLQSLIGLLSDTGYIDNTDPLLLSNAIRIATYFTLFHEIGHIYYCNQPLPSFTEEKGADKKLDKRTRDELTTILNRELPADQFAFAALVLAFNGHLEIKDALSGVILAMGLNISFEFAKQQSNKFFIQNLAALTRMKTILAWAENVVAWKSYLGPNDAREAQLNMDIYIALINRVYTIPSPLTNLLYEAILNPKQDWAIARNQISIWRYFGVNSRKKMFPIIKKFYKNSDNNPKVFELIDYLLQETNGMEPDFGLKSALESSSSY